MRHQVLTILRWIAVLPGAFLASLLTQIGNGLTAGRYVDTDGIFYLVWLTLVSSGVFVYTAAWIAPAHKVPTAIVAAMIQIAWVGISTWIGLTQGARTTLGRYSPLGIWAMAVAGLVGAGGTCIALYLDDRERFRTSLGDVQRPV